MDGACDAHLQAFCFHLWIILPKVICLVNSKGPEGRIWLFVYYLVTWDSDPGLGGAGAQGSRRLDERGKFG